jgi:DUF177 domain-containing protein
VTSPFVVPTAELFRHRGTQSPIHRHGPLPGVALSTSRLADGADVDADLVVEAQGDSVIVTGTVRALWEGECRRCLSTTGGELVVDLQEVFEPDPVEGETYPLGHDHVDLTPALREALALALPVAPLCSEDCAGPDPDDHPVTVESDEPEGEVGEEGEAPADPRWAALDQLKFDR